MRAGAPIPHETTTETSQSLIYYDAWLHDQHPLKGSWVKFTASLVNRLQVPHGWEASHPGIGISGAAPGKPVNAFPLFHYLNHPIPYVQLCGIVADIEYKEKMGFWLVQLDDSSGTLISALFKTVLDPIPFNQRRRSLDETSAVQLAGPNEAITPPVPTWRCCGWLNGVVLDIRAISIGCALRVKGRVHGHERFGRQLLVEKFDIFRSTSQEVQYWMDMCRDFEDILYTTWHIPETRLLQLRSEFEKTKANEYKEACKRERKVRRERKVETVTDQQKDDSYGKKRKPTERSGSSSSDKELAISNQTLSFRQKHPMTVATPTSYQVPPRISSSINISSLEEQSPEVSTGAKDPSYAKVSPDDVDMNDPGEDRDQKSDSQCARSKPAISQDSIDMTDARASTLLQITDMASSSQWRALLSDMDEEPTRSFTGTQWVKLHDDISGQQEESEEIKNLPKQQAQVAKTDTTNRWANLDFDDDHDLPVRSMTGTEWLKEKVRLQ